MDKKLLLKPRLPEAEVEIPGVGKVRVRGLSRAEAMLVRQVEDVKAFECRMIALGMVEPKLTEDEVEQWQQATTPAELEAITSAILDLSGMAVGADKTAYKSVRV